MSKITEIFNKVYDNPAIQTIPFNKDWSNGTGYFDNAVAGIHAPVIPAGEIVKSVTPGNRKILIVGTPIGNMVVFQRYDNGQHDVYVYNTTTVIEHSGWFEGTRMDERQMVIAIGEYGDGMDNIGRTIKRLGEACKRAQAKRELAAVTVTD